MLPDYKQFKNMDLLHSLKVSGTITNFEKYAKWS